MRMTFGTAVAISAIVLMASAFWPEGRPGPAPRQIIAQDESKAAATSAPLRSPMLGDADRGAEATLKSRIEVDYADIPLTDVLADLGHNSSLQFHIKTRLLEENGVATDRLVTLSLKDVSVETALELILEAYDLTYVIRDGIVLITTEDDFVNMEEVRVYNCRDLLEAKAKHDVRGNESGMVPPPGSLGAAVPTVEKASHRGAEHEKAENKRARVDRPRQRSSATHVLAQFGGGGAGMMPGGGGGVGMPQTSSREEQLMNLIQIAVMPDTWEAVGGPGTMGEFDGMIVIRHNPRAHRQVEQVLQMLRDASGQQDWASPDNRPGFPL